MSWWQSAAALGGQCDDPANQEKDAFGLALAAHGSTIRNRSLC